MTEIEQILDLYDRILNGYAWHGDPVWKILEGISAQQASTRISRHTHTIWELVCHMTFWEDEVRRRLQGELARSAKDLNFPDMPEPTPANWKATLKEFRATNRALRAALAKLDSSRLNLPLPGRKRPAYVELHGIIQHDLYHAGQIAFLRKILRQTKGRAGL